HTRWPRDWSSDVCSSDLSFFGGANLSEANLRDSDLTLTDFLQVDLHRANLASVDLVRTDLLQANLNEANIAEARLYRTNFADVSLANISGLELTRTMGPPTIDVATLERTAAELAHADATHVETVTTFLDHAGVSKEYIEFFRSRIGQPIQFYSAFISYSTKDQEFGDRL